MYRYHGFGEFHFKSQNETVEKVEEVKDTVLLIQNTNVSTFFQFIDTLSNFGADKTSLYLLYQVDNLRKAPLLDELHALLDMGKIGLECFEENKQDQFPSSIPLGCLQNYVVENRKQLFLVSGSKEFCGKLTRRE